MTQPHGLQICLCIFGQGFGLGILQYVIKLGEIPFDLLAADVDGEILTASALLHDNPDGVEDIVLPCLLCVLVFFAP